MANRIALKKTQKAQKPALHTSGGPGRRSSGDPEPKLDPLQEETLHRLSALDAVLSPFWSARSGYIPVKSSQA